MPRQTTFLPGATVAERIAAAAKAKRAPTRLQKPADEGLFGSDKDQLDLVALARADQVEAMEAAKADPLASFWAGSASASVAHHVRRGAVRTLTAK